jgi:hypothetical protein
MSVLELKQQYNTLLMRQYKGQVYLDDTSKPDREKWLPEYQKVVEELNGILSELQRLGVTVTEREVLGGFDVEG